MKKLPFAIPEKIKTGLILTLIPVALAITFGVFGFFQIFSFKFYDMLFRLSPLSPPSREVVVVTVGQSDLDFFKDQGISWPWPRKLYAPIIDFCKRGQARAVIFDVLFTEPSVYGPEDDQILAKAATQAGNVTFACFLSLNAPQSISQVMEALDKAGLDITGLSPSGFPLYRSVATPILPLLAAARSLGDVRITPDPDGIYRRLPLVLPLPSQYRWLPLLGFAPFAQFVGQEAWRFTQGALVQGAHHIPLDDGKHFLLKFRGPSRSHQHFSAAQIINFEALIRQGEQPIWQPEIIKDKTVFVGLTAPGLLDLTPTPLSPVYPGVELHATLLDNLLKGDFLRSTSPIFPWTVAVFCTVAVVLATLFSSRWLFNFVAFFLIGDLVLLQTYVAFRFFSWWSDPAVPLFSLGFAFAMTVSYRYVTETQQRRIFQRMFVQDISPKVIDYLMEHRGKSSLGAEARTITLLFLKVPGFTTMSENLAPEDLLALLLDYRTMIADLIVKADGTLDRWKGHTMQGFWGAPMDQADHAARACHTALKLQDAMADFGRILKLSGRPVLRLTIGIHTGVATLLNLGTEKQLDYTPLGDNVELALRLGSLNNLYGTPILASAATMEACGPDIEFRELDLIRVKGKNAPIAVYEVMAVSGALTSIQRAAREQFAQGLKLYRQRQFAAAKAYFARTDELQSYDGPAQLYLRRCEVYEEHPPPDTWDGVTESPQ
jgi:adenylate cyclase